MPIKILDAPEPLSLASRIRSEMAPLIESDAYRQLVHELRRYCNGEISGRSFLIAGHRGSGKTTLVTSAFDALLRAPRTLMMRPLLVLLQGPTLLPGSKEELPRASDGAGEAGRPLTEMENVLVQITLGLHRAVAREINEAFRAHVLRATEHDIGEQREMVELAAQLQLELDEYSGKARLREIWRRGQALPHGILHPVNSGAAVARILPGDQGFRELVGLSSVCDAYRRISGKISRKDEQKAGASDKAERSVEIDAKGKDFAGPLIALLTGAAVGTGTLGVNGNPAIASLAGVLTALASMVVGKASWSRSRQRSASLEDLFIPDLSVATLDRVLPVLIDRLREAGLAPVFVIDELDKVDRLSERIPEMIRRLKKLVAENACFCFLADRRYFEEMRLRNARVAYSIEHTYFTHQLFIAFRHTDMRAYLQRVLVKPETPIVAAGDLAPARRIAEEQADYIVLPYILMHGAQLHPIDLLRQLSQLRSGDGNVALEPGAVRTRRRYRLELLSQLAIELQLEQEAMQEELDRRPAFRRLAYDALYYVSREWEKDDERLSLAEDARSTFERYLVRRMDLEPPTTSTVSAVTAAPSLPADTPISSEDLTFLWRAVHSLAKALAAPETLREQLVKRGAIDPVVHAALRGAIGLGPLLSECKDEPDVYRWRFRRSGREVGPDPSAVVVAEAPWTRLVPLIRNFEAAVAAMSNGAVDPSTLSTMLGLLPTSPAWPSVSTALSRLEGHVRDDADYAEKEEDVSAVTACFDILRPNISTVALALFCGHVISAWNARATHSPLLTALESMSLVLRLRELRPEQVAQHVRDLTAQVAREAVMPALPPDATDVDGVGVWIECMKRVGTAVPVPGERLDSLRATALGAGWEYWRVRLEGGAPDVGLGVLIASVMMGGPFSLLRLPPEAMTAREWSDAFVWGVTRDPDPNRGEAPAWLALAALQQLGWGTRIPELVKADSGPRRLSLFGDKPLRVDELAAIQSWKLGSNLSPEAGSAIIVGNGGTSETWPRMPPYAVLVLRPDECERLQSLWRPAAVGVLLRLAYDWVVVDATRPDARRRWAGPRRQVAKGSGHIEEARAVVDVFRLAAKAAAQPIPLLLGSEASDPLTQYRTIVGAKSLEDLFVRLGPPIPAVPA
jgi:hypothetical protein